MTQNQIAYQNMLVSKEKVEGELELGQLNYEETNRHNLETEKVAREQLQVNWHQAESSRMNAEAAIQNAKSNAMNAETNRLNYYVNVYDSQSRRISANAAAAQASAALQMAALASQEMPYTIALKEAQAEQYRAYTDQAYAQTRYLGAQYEKSSAETMRIQALLPYETRNYEASIYGTYAQASYVTGKNSREIVALPYEIANKEASTYQYNARGDYFTQSAADIRAKLNANYWDTQVGYISAQQSAMETGVTQKWIGMGWDAVTDVYDAAKDTAEVIIKAYDAVTKRQDADTRSAKALYDMSE